MIRFQCDCGRELQGRDEDAGRAAKCPQCGKVVTIPARAADAPAPAAPAAEAVQASPREGRRADERVEADPPRRSRGPAVDAPAGSSGKATAALILGISSFCLLIPAIPGIILGALALRDINRSEGRLAGTGMAITGIVLSCCSFILIAPVAILIGLLLPAVSKVREAAARTQEANHLKQIGLAMHNHHDAMGRLPAAATPDLPGQPPSSWRVAILPFIEQDNLFRQYRFNETWDSPTNRTLQGMMPKVYQTPAREAPQGMTHFQVLVGPGTLFEDARKVRQDAGRLGLSFGRDIPDGTSNTVMVVLGQTPVVWTKPEDIPFDPNGPVPALSNHYRTGYNVLMADGSVRFVGTKVSPQTWRSAIIRNDGMALGPDW